MKKLMTIALCFAAIGSMSAQKANVDAAKKAKDLKQAREFINQAKTNPETANDVNTYYIAGKIEFDAFDKDYAASMINPAAADAIAMGTELLNAYDAFTKALPLDSLPNEKGQVKPKFSKDMLAKIAGHANDYFKAAVDFYNAGKLYPEAYQGFMIYADMPEQPFMAAQKLELPASDRGTAYFNAGLAAYTGNQVLESADAFRKARKVGHEEKEAYIYEIACWQALAQRDSTMEETAKDKIIEVATDGYKKFGVAEPIFINNIVNFQVTDGKYDEAIATVTELLGTNPDNAGLYGLRGFVYERKGDNDASVADYRKAVSLPGVDYETLKNAAKRIYRVGADKWNMLDGNSEEVRKARKDVKANYFEAAKAITDQAKTMNSDGDLDYLIENIDYALGFSD